MCCDICPEYIDCAKKNQIKGECCSECPEYDYCKAENNYDASDIEEDD